MPALPGEVRPRRTGDTSRGLVPENPAGEATPGREQSAGYARRRHLLRDRGRGFDSHRLHLGSTDEAPPAPRPRSAIRRVSASHAFGGRGDTRRELIAPGRASTGQLARRTRPRPRGAARRCGRARSRSSRRPRGPCPGPAHIESPRCPGPAPAAPAAARARAEDRPGALFLVDRQVGTGHVPTKSESPVSTAHGAVVAPPAVHEQERGVLGPVPWGVQRADAQRPEPERPAVAEGLVVVAGLGVAVDVDRRARGGGEAPVTGDVVGVGVGLEHVLDVHARVARQPEVLVDVQSRVDDRGDAGVLVADQVAGAAEVVVGGLAEVMPGFSFHSTPRSRSERMRTRDRRHRPRGPSRWWPPRCCASATSRRGQGSAPPDRSCAGGLDARRRGARAPRMARPRRDRGRDAAGAGGGQRPAARRPRRAADRRALELRRGVRGDGGGARRADGGQARAGAARRTPVGAALVGLAGRAVRRSTSPRSSCSSPRSASLRPSR